MPELVEYQRQFALQRATESCSVAKVCTALCDEILPGSFARLN